MRWAVAIVVVLCACASSPHAPAPKPVAAAAPAPRSRPRDTGPLALASSLAVVADEDPPSVRGFDVELGREMWAVPLDGTPGHLAVARDGTIFVAVRDRDRVDVLAPGGRPQTFAETCAEPIGMALDPDERTLYVACGFGHELLAISIDTRAVAWRLGLPLEPRAVLVTADGARAVVSQAVGGRVTVVELASRTATTMELRGAMVGAREGFRPSFGATNRGASMVASNGFALAEHGSTVYAAMFVGGAERGPNTSETYYGTDMRGGVAFPIVPGEAKANRWLYATLAVGAPHGCLAPRGVAVRLGEPEPRILVACPGNDQLIEHDVDGEIVLRRVVSGGPSAVVVDWTADRAIVWSQAGRLLTVIDLRTRAAAEVYASGSPNASALVRRGQRLFDSTDDPRVSFDGRGCATCHPDGRADALTWGTPEGPRQTAMLAGRLEGTDPYGWTRGSPTTAAYIRETMHRLGGDGLGDQDLAALAAYVEALPAPRRRTSPTVALGKQVFEGKAGCASCHAGPRTTDGRSHDIGSATSSDRIHAFDTPSLRFLGDTAPYFHDGRYATLHDLLVDPERKMGQTKRLAPEELAALEEYLKAL
jgi:mono/diheme cytochrome c family protein